MLEALKSCSRKQNYEYFSSDKTVGPEELTPMDVFFPQMLPDLFSVLDFI